MQLDAHIRLMYKYCEMRKRTVMFCISSAVDNYNRLYQAATGQAPQPYGSEADGYIDLEAISKEVPPPSMPDSCKRVGDEHNVDVDVAANGVIEIPCLKATERDCEVCCVYCSLLDQVCPKYE